MVYSEGKIPVKLIENRRMLSLTEYNEKREKEIEDYEKRRHLSGVLCPGCLQKNKEVELYQDMLAILTCIPPKSHVRCPKCDFRGYKII